MSPNIANPLGGQDFTKEAEPRKDAILVTVAHELRNLLAPIRNAVQILQVKGLPEAESQWARDLLDRQVELMTRLVDDLVDLTQADPEGKLSAINGPEDGPSSPTEWGHRILVVDDNKDAANCLAKLLRKNGDEVHTAYDGLEAVAAAAVFRPDLVLLDISLPKLDGYEVARRIREQPGGGDVVIIAVTGWGGEEDRRLSSEAGFSYHLIKPIETEALQRLLTRFHAQTP